MATWNRHLADAVAEQHDGPVVAKAPADEAVWEREFNDGYGRSQGDPVLAWTMSRVYFPVVYDGAEWLDSAPRFPQTDGQDHVGGQ